MKLAIIGSRSITNKAIIWNIIDRYQFTTLISGGAKGVDSIAEEYAATNNKDIIIHRPDYSLYGSPMAQFIRNSKIIEESNMVLAIHDGKSTGTQDSMNKTLALRRAMDVWLVTKNIMYSII